MGHTCPAFHPLANGDWKVARTRRLESLRYVITGIALIWKSNTPENAGVPQSGRFQFGDDSRATASVSGKS